MTLCLCKKDHSWNWLKQLSRKGPLLILRLLKQEPSFPPRTQEPKMPPENIVGSKFEVTRGKLMRSSSTRWTL
uniref:HDC15675 n=1 Tax=Drosophila melanogaster TaxID=7227 RepID=Q6IJ86_DROME|nr:TPA_inf: HDC15675 [Drosophila melanogaster]